MASEKPQSAAALRRLSAVSTHLQTANATSDHDTTLCDAVAAALGPVPQGAVHQWSLRSVHAASRGGSGLAAARAAAAVAPSRFACAASTSASGRVAVITGVTSGIGRALATELATQGWIVCGCGRRDDALRNVKKELRGSGHVLMRADVTRLDDMEAFARAVHGAGHTDVEMLVCNSGVNINSASLYDVPPEEFNRLMQTNLFGVFNTMKAFVPRMVAAAASPSARLKRVIGISSGLGHSTSHRLGAYCASKWAVEAMCKSVAQSFATDGRNAISVPLAPGVLNTGMSGVGKSLDDWVKVAVPFVLGLGKGDNGASVAVPGFYDPEYVATWVIPDGMPLATAVVRPK